MARRKKQISEQALKRFVRNEASRFLAKPNITSVGIGYKVTKGKRSRDLSVQFTVAQKVAPEQLESLGSPALPTSVTVDGVDVPTDVIERSYVSSARQVSIGTTLESAAARKSAVDPVLPGVSIGHPSISAGTAGCVVYHAQTGAPFVLSNWHVLSGPDGAVGDDIIQPGRHDDNRVDRNVIGRLVRSHLGVAGDCAIASVDQRKLESEVLDIGIPVAKIGEPELGDRVVKSGRTTDVTYGIVSRIHVTTEIDFGVGGNPLIERIGCFEIEPDPRRPARGGEISMGGDSGSCWLSLKRGRPTDMMLGLHFAGETGDAPEHALACYAGSVFEKLNIRPAQVEGMEATRQDLGYALQFLGQTIALPTPNDDNVASDVLEVDGRAIFDYTHFSLGMSASRKLASWVAWNVDGSSLRKLSHRGTQFRRDRSIPRDAQIGNELYRKNALDRGHLARRADLTWGTLAEARRANEDSFFYTNIAPQHEAFNQSSAGGIWGELENAIFEEVDLEDLRISVMAGPVFSDDDPSHRRVQLPREFWKIVYFREAGEREVQARGYVLTQVDLLNQIEALELPEFSVFEVPVNTISLMTGFELSDAPHHGRGRRQDVVGEDGTGGVRRIGSRAEIVE